MKWEADQREEVFGWVPPRKRGEEPQPRWEARVDIEAALADLQVTAVLDVWSSARMHEAPAYSGGVVDAWPAVMVDGLGICRTEEQAIDLFTRWHEQEASRG